MISGRQRKGINVPFKEMMPAISEKWRNLSQFEKAQYESRAVEDKERYKSEMEFLGLAPDIEAVWEGRRKPRNAYTFFQSHMMKKLKERETGK
eukprot:Pgem_evm1s16543